MSLFHLISRGYAERPSAVAIEIWPGGRRISYREWWEECAVLAGSLPERNRPGDYLAFEILREWELPFALLAAWMRGLAVLPVQAGMRESELSALFAECGLPVAFWRGLPGERGKRHESKGVQSDDPALLLATSGTSSAPKVFLFRQRELHEAARIEADALGETTARRILNLRPAFTSGGTNTLWPALYLGAPLCFAEGTFRLPRREALSELLRELSPSAVIVSPSYVRALFAEAGAGRLSEQTLPLFYGGSCLRAKEHEFLRSAGFEPRMRYGMTECAHILSVQNFTNGDVFDGSDVGTLSPGLEAEVRDRKLAFRSPGFAPFFLLSNAKLIPCLEQGWYQSDDLGKLEGNRIFLEGREHRQIVVAGLRVSTAEVEECLMSSGLLSDCAVSAISDSLWGERIAALLVPIRPEEELLEKIRERCRQMLSAHKVPSRLEIVPEIPAMPNGKRDLKAISGLLERA